jgi:hypothetical protein
MKSEFDRVTAEFEKEKERLLAQAARNVKDAYYRGFLNGKDVMADSVSECLARRTAIPFMSDRPDLYPTLGHP